MQKLFEKDVPSKWTARFVFERRVPIDEQRNKGTYETSAI
jgi:hypothetical protein